MRRGTEGSSKPGRAEGRRLPASRSISVGGRRNRIAAVDARWQICQGGHRGLVDSRKTATKGTSLAECRSLAIVRHAGPCGRARLPADEMHERLRALLERM